MARRTLLKPHDRQELVGIPTDEDSLIRHYSLSPADRLEIEVRRREHNRLGFALQLCLMRYPGRALIANEALPMPMLNHVAEQVGADPASFELYARREETRMNHVARLLGYLEMRSPTGEDRRAALLAAIETASTTDKGAVIANAIITMYRERRVLLPVVTMIERMGLAARAIARRRAEAALISDLDPDKLEALDALLDVDPAIGQTRFHWLRSAPDAPGAGNLVGLTERIMFLRSLGIDPRLQARIPSGRWDQMVREGDAAPAWLAGEFGASRRRATIVVQIIKLGQKLTDDAMTMFIKLMGRLFSHGLAAVAEAGAQLLITTHDRRFARSVVAENRMADRVQHLSVHAVNSVHPTLSLSPTIEEVDRLRQAFINNPDSAVAAQDYASNLRVFIEARLGDLFDDLAEPAHATSTQALTLFPLLDRLRALITNGGGELFSNPVLRRFVGDPGLVDGADPRRVLNKAHHSERASITYVDVKDVEPAFVRLRTAIEKVHEQFRLHRWREPLAPTDASETNVVSLPTMARPTFSVPICPDIAAFSRSVPAGGSQDMATEQLNGEWFDGKALFYVRGETLGFAVPSGAVAIVEAEAYPGRDRNLVIARHQGNVLARRLLKAPGSLGISLATQTPDPRIPRPTMTYDESKVRLFRIVGAIFTDMAPPSGGGEATAIDMVQELGRIEVAYRIREDSAVPLALPGQIILGGAELTPSELDAWEGKLVAVTLDDGTSIFKRVGASLSGSLAHLRQFETIGGLGSSMVVATEVLDGAASAPAMVSARRVLGVLYDQT